MNKKSTVLMVLDGYGLSTNKEGNAIALADTPVMDKLMAQYPHGKGSASGLDVGLPDGQMGNSEVGHTNIGAGRVVYQELTRITKSITDGDFFENPAFLSAIENCRKHNSQIHIWGLVSDGGVHSHMDHIFGLLEFFHRKNITPFVHCFMDGRDTPPKSGIEYISQLEEKIKETGGKIATVSGRFYAMDRDKRWERLEKAYKALVLGEGETAETAKIAMENSYAAGVNDEFVLPTVITENEAPIATVKENDSVIFFNFRPDRAREITRAFVDPEFNFFPRPKGMFNLKYVCMTEYDSTIPKVDIAFKPTSLINTLGEYISSLGLTQFRIAETEKYAHVTFFFNGGVETPYSGEARTLIPSPKVATYDLQPEMSAGAVTDSLVAAIESGLYDLIVINYANCDMVGHTGFINAAIKAVEYVDSCVGRVYDAIIKTGNQMFICADHGNSDKMMDESGGPFTAHTTNPVPFIVVNCPVCKGLKKDGKLCDISPTLLDMMELPKPAEMTGHSLLIK